MRAGRDHQPPAPIERGSRGRAVAVGIGLPLALFLALAMLLDGPARQADAPGRASRAAVAIRDRVHPVEMLATWAFVQPRLAAGYDEVRCIAEDPGASRSARDAFRSALGALAADHDVVDVFCLAHTNAYVTWLEGLAPPVREKIRLVYNAGCHCGGQADVWLSLGADAYVAHAGIASHAPFFVWFLRRFLAGHPLDAAVAEANAKTTTFYERLSVLGPALVRERNAWSRSPGEIHGDRDVVLGSTP